MLRPIDNYFLQQEEPVKSCLQFLREHIKINHPDLLREKRARMKILLVDPGKDIPVRKINDILKQVLKFYQ